MKKTNILGIAFLIVVASDFLMGRAIRSSGT
jgi:hypothetical protein